MRAEAGRGDRSRRDRPWRGHRKLIHAFRVSLDGYFTAEVAQSVDSVLILNHGRLVAERHINDLPDPRALEALYLEATTEEPA